MKINLDPDKPVRFITVPHTGTTSTRMMLDQMGIEYRQHHFEKIPEITIDDVLESCNLITTYRDPFEVAASWANRVGFTIHYNRIRRWNGNWTRWGLMVHHAVKVVAIEEMTEHRNKNARGDVTGVFAMLEAGDWDRYFEIVPREAVGHAYEIASSAGYKSPYGEAL